MSSDKISFSYIACVLFLLACDILPFVQMQMNMVQRAGLNFVFLMVYVFPKQGFKTFLGVSLRLLPFILVSFFISREENFKYGMIHPYMLFFTMISPVFISIDLIRRNNKKEILIVFISLCFMLLFVLISSFIELLINPAVLREMTAISVTDEEYMTSMKTKGIGGFGIAYGAGILLLSLLTSYNSIRRKSVKILLLVVMCFLAVFIINANFTTLLLITLMSVFVYLYLNNKSNLYRFGLCFLLGLFVLILPAILVYAIDYYGDTSTARHLNDILMSITGKGNIESERSIYTYTLWNRIIESPLWGHNINHSKEAFLYANSHSTFLGYFFSTGLIGLISYYAALWFIVKKLILHIQVPAKSICVMSIYYLLLAYFNPSESIEVSVCIFFFFPLLHVLIRII